jgi:hypothetical protein
MSTPAFVVLVLLAVIFARSVGRARRRRSGWGVFLTWVLAGFLSAFASVSFAIGLLVLPLAVVAIVVASRLAVWPEVSGFVGESAWRPSSSPSSASASPTDMAPGSCSASRAPSPRRSRSRRSAGSRV